MFDLKRIAARRGGSDVPTRAAMRHGGRLPGLGAGALVLGLGAGVLFGTAGASSSVSVQAEKPPRPSLASHGTQIRAARTGYCEDPEAPGCAPPDVFLTTKPLPVHARGRVLIKIHARAQDVRLALECGGERRVKKLSARRWRFRVSRKQGRRDRCDHGEFGVLYGRGKFNGGGGAYQFSTRPHRHR